MMSLKNDEQLQSSKLNSFTVHFLVTWPWSMLKETITIVEETALIKRGGQRAGCS